MPQFKTRSVKVGSGILICLLVITVPLKAQSQSLPPSPTIPIDPTKIPEQILEQTNPVLPQNPSLVPSSQQVKPSQINQVIEFAITTTSVRYPWLTNPTDKLTFSPTIFNPSNSERYLDTDIRFANKNPNIVKLTYGYFPKNEQFYWVLPNNRIVIETQGYQAGVIQQGQATDLNFSSVITLSRALTGNQVVTTLPEVFPEITNNQNPATFSVQTTVGQIINPPGTIASPVVINSGINLNAPNVTIIRNETGTGSTNSPQGGGSNFGNLEAQNTPQVIQGFPTVNLQAIFGNGSIPFREGSVVSEAGLAELGLSLGGTSNQTLKGFSSFAGIKVLQPDKFDNFDLLQILTRPNLKQSEREFYYLNSLFWADLGQRTPQVVTRLNRSNSSWQRLYISRPVNQSMISYDAKEIKAKFDNRFVNLGVSISYSFDKGSLNFSQSVNNTLGMLLGSAFVVLDPQNLQDRVEEAKKFRDDSAKNNVVSFTPLATAATPEQRQQINQRLNTSLLYSSLSSPLEQVSGNLAIDSNITPSSSNLFQVKTGLYRRLVQFLDQDIQRSQGDTIISNLRTNVNKFGPLTFLDSQIPTDLTGFLPSNESFASEVVLTAPDGRQFVDSINSSDPSFTTIPTGIRRLAIAFDRIELRRIDRESGKFSSYLGSVSLPSIEAAWTGSINNLNYSISSGLWFNVAPNSAGNVSNNTLGTSEPSIGAFLNGLIVWNTSSVETGENNAVTAVTTQSPVIRVSLNSATNSNNASFVNLSYTISRQMQGMSFSVTPGVVFADQKTSFKTISFLQSSLNLGDLSFRSSLELDDSLLWSLETVKPVGTGWSVGAFIKSSREINQGFDSRVNETNYGLLFRYQIPQTPTSIEAQLGNSSSGIDLRIRGNLRL
ncbi:hypothetical protein HCU40_11425 [Pseudanabaena biceps]|nr:hypothetical protein [Pseudanabaena biceps]